jgi:hypothetical protein
MLHHMEHTNVEIGHLLRVYSRVSLMIYGDDDVVLFGFYSGSTLISVQFILFNSICAELCLFYLSRKSFLSILRKIQVQGQ